MRVIHRGLILTFVPLILSVTIVAIMFSLVLQTDAQRAEEAKHRKIAELTSHVMLGIYDAGLALEHSFQQHRPELRQRFKDDMIELHQNEEELLRLGQNDPHTAELLDAWNGCVNGSMDKFRTVLKSIHSRFSISNLLRLNGLRLEFANNTFRLIDTFHHLMEAPIRYLDDAPKREQSIFTFECGVLLAGVLLSSVLAFFLSRWFMREFTSRLQVIAENSLRLSKEQPLLPLVKGTDEIADLDRAFHSMAEHLSAAMLKERAIFQSASDIICVFDADGRFVAINPACSRILNFNAQDLVGSKLVDYTFPDDVAKTAEALRQVRTGDPAAIFENRVRNKSNDYLDLLWSLYWSQSQNLGFAIAHDISEAKRIERMKEEFLGMVSHDLRSPLSSVSGTFQLMIAGAFGKLPDTINEKSEMANRNANRLLRLINDLLDLGKLETGMFELVRQDSDMDTLVKRALSEVEPLAEKKGVRLTLQNSVQTFNVDPDRMMQVLVNLLSNAIKFSPDNGEVRVRAKQVGGIMRLEVLDQGRGVPPAYRQAIFERFKQVDISDAKGKGGTGLGLPICKQIVELHGGKIGVESEGPNLGSIFWLTIPSEHKPSAAELPPAPDPPTAAIKDGAADAHRTVRPAERQSDSQQTRLGYSPTNRKFSFENLRLSRKGAILVIFPVLFEIIFALSMFALLSGAFQLKQEEQRERAVASHAAYLLVDFYTLGTIMSTDKTQDVWTRFGQASDESISEQNRLLDLTSKHAEENNQVKNLIAILAPAHAFMDHAKQVVERQGSSPDVMENAFANRSQLESVMSDAAVVMEQLIHQANEKESQTLNGGNRTQQGRLMIAGLVVSALISGLSAWLFSVGITKRISIIHENTRRLDAGRHLNPSLPGEDEIAHLDHVFHSMALALKEARAKEQAVFDNSQDVMCVIANDGKILRINPACERLWAYKPAELIGRSILGIMVEPDRERAAWHLSNNLNSQNRQMETRIICNDKNRTVKIMHWALSWSPEENGNVAIAHDVTKRKELEQLKQEFLSMVSHDMRTPLSAIQGMTKLMQVGAFGALPDKAMNQLGVVERSCSRLLALVNDLLDMDKLESGNMQLAIQPTQLLDVVERTCQALESFAKQHKTSFDTQVAPDLMANADGDRLVQVGVNLLSNAIKYSPEGGVVTISAYQNRGIVEVRITDQGPGIPPQYLNAIFERYKMAPSVDGKKRAGTGLGLPICKQIIEQHGGSIGVESEVGRGSTFWFTVPVAPVFAPAPVEGSA